MIEKRLEELCVLARDIEGAGNQRLASFILDKNKVISYGFNQYKTHPLQAKYGEDRFKIHQHAEINAIVNAVRNREITQNKTLVVVRVLKNGQKALAKPCMGCMRAIKDYGFKKVIYTTPEGYVTWQI